jgi:hypothetical protein
MLEIIATIFMVSVGVAFGLVILAYAIYLTFYPLTRTVVGGLQVLKHYGEQRARALEHDYIPLADARLGFTMADGGSRIKKKRSSKNKK